MTIKLIALDLDGTTLNKSGRLSARTKAALEEAIRGGVHVGLEQGGSDASAAEQPTAQWAVD